MNPVGYLRNTAEGLVGARGIGYDYILAAHGLFLRASNPLLSATILIASAEVRGLAPLTERMVLSHDRIPLCLIETNLTFLTSWGHELYLAVVWQDGAYAKVIPAQTGATASVQYQRRPHTLLDVHTHGKLNAFFSSTDDLDERGFQIYMVVGRLDQPVWQVALRLGVYGYFRPLDWGEVFDQPPPWLEPISAYAQHHGGEGSVSPDLR